MDHHWWILNTQGPVAPANLKAHLEAQRDHYSNTTLVAGKDPRDGAVLKHHGYEHVLAQMDQGIAALVAATAGFIEPVHATVRGVLRPADDRNPGDELIVSVSVAQTPKATRTPTSPTTPSPAAPPAAA